MKIKIKRFDKEIPLPKRATDGAAAFDLIARIEMTIEPGKVGYIPLNIAVETPHDHFLMVAPRSSTHKKGLFMANGVGIIDPDYSGNEDELRAPYYNMSDKPVVIEKGERIAQAVFVPIAKFEWEETEKMQNKTRGGFGTTGK